MTLGESRGAFGSVAGFLNPIARLRLIPLKGGSRTGTIEWKRYSHSIVPGGLLVTSSTTRFTPATSLMMRLEIFSMRS